MPPFTIHTQDSAPAASRALLQGLQQAFGFVPNLYAVMAESPAALKGAIAMADGFSRTTLSPAEQQLVALAVSATNDCRFCVAAHSLLAKSVANADAAAVAALREGRPLKDKKLDALICFTRRVVQARGLVSEADVAGFIEAGYCKAQLLEVLFAVGLKTFNNYVAHIAQVPLNDQFKSEAWQPKECVA